MLSTANTQGGGSCSFIGGLTVTLNAALDSEDWADIQANIYLATEPANTYLSMQAGFLTQGSNSPISSSSAIQVYTQSFAPCKRRVIATLFPKSIPNSFTFSYTFSLGDISSLLGKQ